MFLICEWFSVETLPSQSRSRWIPRLNDEIRNQSVKDDSIVVACHQPYFSISSSRGFLVIVRSLASFELNYREVRRCRRLIRVKGTDIPSIDRAMKFLTVFGHSLPHNSISISPAVVTTITLALVAGFHQSLPLD